MSPELVDRKKLKKTKSVPLTCRIKWVPHLIFTPFTCFSILFNQPEDNFSNIWSYLQLLVKWLTFNCCLLRQMIFPWSALNKPFLPKAAQLKFIFWESVLLDACKRPEVLRTEGKIARKRKRNKKSPTLSKIWTHHLSVFKLGGRLSNRCIATAALIRAEDFLSHLIVLKWHILTRKCLLKAIIQQNHWIVHLKIKNQKFTFA